MALNPFQVRIRIRRDRVVLGVRTKRLARIRAKSAAIAAASLLPLVLFALPATAATSGGNASTLNLAPAAIRSLTVTPATSTFGNCSGGNTSEMSIPSGTCGIGTNALVTGTITNGITITNGSVAGHIDVVGGSAIASDAGTSWTLVGASPSANQFEEVATGGTNGVEGSTTVSTVSQCDSAFDADNGVCTATAGQSQEEALVITGPTASTDAGPFTVTTTWTAVS
jgi:hypothetical protein